MDDKVYLWDLYDESTKEAFKNKAISKNPFYDLSQIPSQKMRNEVRAFIQWRSTKVCPQSLYLDIKYHKKLCRFFSECTSEKNSLKDRDVNAWIKKFKAWLFKEGVPIYEQVKHFNGTIYTMKIRDINYLRQLVLFTQPDNRKEVEKDVWELDKLDIEYRANPIKRARRLIFTGIPQDGIRQEVKKGIYLNLQSEAITCIQMEMTAIRRLSKYLADRFPEIDSCRELTREIIEEYLIYLKTEATETKHYHADLNRLRSLLESTGKMCEYENLAGLFLARDVPPTPKAKFTVYSDNELKRLNREIVNLDEQTARLMIIHQMLGTRISDTLTLAPDCLSEKNGEIIIRIRQMKTKPYEKPISAELAALIHKSIDYTHERYGDSYIQTGNSVMNYIINSKLENAHRKGIEFKAEIENIPFEKMGSVDFSALLSNILDNAVEASEKTESKFIYVAILKKRAYDTILVKNSIDASVLKKNPELLSSKKDSEQHGYGIKQIKAIAEKYDGIADIYEEDNMFCVNVMIPS